MNQPIVERKIRFNCSIPDLGPMVGGAVFSWWSNSDWMKSLRRVIVGSPPEFLAGFCRGRA
ncbi:MAG: hypothetical protein WBD27_04750 [Pyrinomonadaceae bacterium]